MWICLISKKNDAEDLGVEALEFYRQSTSQAIENTCGDRAFQELSCTECTEDGRKTEKAGSSVSD
jgi:hypothetical protein